MPRLVAALATTFVVVLSACSPDADANPDIFITKEGNVLWNGEPITCMELNARFRAGSETKTEYPCDIFGRVSTGQ
jgi:hypothetical protein